MGLFIESYRGRKHVSHGGNLDGFSLILSFLPDDGVGVVVLTNLDGTYLATFCRSTSTTACSVFESIDWVARFREIEKKARTRN